MSPADALVEALLDHEQWCSKTVDRLRELSTPETENEVYSLTMWLRDAIILVGCLRRLTKGCTPHAIHAAFGAPGDFGYGTKIGAALAALYRGGAS